MNRLELLQAYDRYVDGYRGADGQLPVMMRLKREHTAHVVENAERIAAGENFAADVCETAWAAALLHDTGRYEQLRRYDTFRDSESVDHAVFSHDIVVAKGWLDGRPDRSAILNAVLYHNRRDLPEDMDARTAVAAHTVRDADKLDIFRVLEDQVEHTDWRRDARAFWNLKTVAPPSPEVVSRIERGVPVDYQNIRVLADFVLIQIGWMKSELHFATTRRLCAARGHLEYRRRFLRQLTSDPVTDRLCDLVAAELKSAAAEG